MTMLSRREGEEAMPYAKSLWIAVVILLLCCSQRAIAIEQQGMQESQGTPSSLRAVTKDGGVSNELTY